MGEFGLEGVRIDGGGEVAVRFAPVTPASAQSRDDLSDGALGAEDRIAVVVGDRRAVRGVLGNAGLAEILADDDVGRELTPGCWNLRVVHFEDHRAVCIGDATCSCGPLDRVVHVAVLAGESSGNLHMVRSSL